MHTPLKYSIRQFVCYSAKAVAAIGVSIAMFACSSEQLLNVPTLDIAANIDCADTGTLNDIFEMHALVHPELTDSTLLAYPEIRGVYGNTLYMQQDNSLMTFDISTGKSLSSFDRRGLGPEDYILLYSAFPSRESGDWVGYDLQGMKLVRYTAEGKFLDSCHARFSSLSPSGNNFAGQKFMRDGEEQMFYIYSDKLQPVDSISTHKQRSIILNNMLLEEFNGLAAFRATDTLYAISPDNRIMPAVAFTLNQYATPYYKLEESKKYFAEQKNYIYYSFHGAGNIGCVFYQFNDNNILQYYSLTDNSLLFSACIPMEKLPDFLGFPFIIDGNKYFVKPLGENPVSDGMFCFIIDSEEFGDSEENPAILLLKPKM
ncbi:MAG: 6-bladed beta-propeller [Paramuribaculum sp.]|nr:6-bladed beta-propeller [Paramuribaculum sp.]